MDKFQQFKLKIEKMDYIKNPYDFIYETEEEFNSYEFLEFIRIVHLHNQDITARIKKETSNISSIIKSAQPVTPIVEKKEEKIVVIFFLRFFIINK